jgi:hypothetical protein
MKKNKNNVIFKPSSNIVNKKGEQIGSLEEAFKIVSCNLFFDVEIGAIGIRDAVTKEVKYMILEDGSLTFKDTRQEVCDVINS